MSYHYLLDAGMHPETINRAKSQSVDPSAVIAIINEFLTVLTGGGAGIVQAVLDLLALFAPAMGKQARPPVTSGITRTMLLQAGVNKELLAKAESMSTTPADVLAWITTIFNVISVAGPSLLAAIAAILQAFNPPTPTPAPTGTSEAPNLGIGSA